MKLYIAHVEDICRCEIEVYASTPEEAEKLLKAEYYRFKKGYQIDMTFTHAMEYFGGGIDEITLPATMVDRDGDNIKTVKHW